jgi:hypothetical protein
MIAEEKTDLLEIARQLRSTPPDIDPILAAATGFYELTHSLAKVYPMQVAPLGSRLKALHQEIEAHLLATGSPTEKSSYGIPRVPASAIADSSFAEFIKEPCPVIFDRAAADSAAVREWSPEFFLRNYGDFPCYLAKQTDWEIQGTLSDAIDDILNPKTETRYAHNIANIFNEHPDLEAMLELERFLPHLGPGRHMGTHLFIGGPGTGTAFHCANNLNVFMNVYGRKEWHFVHPKYSFWMYAELQKNGSAADSPIDHNKSAAEQSDNYPLFQQVPVYSAVLEPGDVMINPPWWWHAINNKTDATIACAVRWLPQATRNSHPVFSVAQNLVPNAKEVMKILRDPKGRMTDELYRNTFEPTSRLSTQRAD